MGKPIGIAAVGWTVLITVLFMLPTLSPITARNFNYTSVAIAVVLGFAAVWWFASARHWFTGPRISDLRNENELPGANELRAAVPDSTTAPTPQEENG